MKSRNKSNGYKIDLSNGDLKKKIYIEQLKGFFAPKQKNKICIGEVIL